MTQNAQNKTAFRLLGLVAVMLGLAFASVPMYDWFCRVTGFGGVTQTAITASDTVLDREITVRFDGSLDSNMHWNLNPFSAQ